MIILVTFGCHVEKSCSTQCSLIGTSVLKAELQAAVQFLARNEHRESIFSSCLRYRALVALGDNLELFNNLASSIIMRELKGKLERSSPRWLTGRKLSYISF